MAKYGQFCPVAKAAEILGERWMLLVVRELVCGSRRYGELQRGLGRISPGVLSQRLKTLVDAGVIRRVSDAAPACYELTEAGRELEPVIMAVGTWGQRWSRSRLTRGELDVELLVLELARNLDTEALGLDPAVLALCFTDLHGEARRWWLRVERAHVDICRSHPGRPHDVQLTGTLRALTEVWRGDLSPFEAIRAGSLVVDDPARVVKRIERWLGVSRLAHVAAAASL